MEHTMAKSHGQKYMAKVWGFLNVSNKSLD